MQLIFKLRGDLAFECRLRYHYVPFINLCFDKKKIAENNGLVSPELKCMRNVSNNLAYVYENATTVVPVGLLQ